MGEEEFETFGLHCTRKSRDGSNIQKLNDDVMEVINEYVPINNLLETCKELHKLKKKFILIELDEKKTVRLFKEDGYRNYIYSLIDNPMKQLTLNIIQYNVFYEKERTLYFIFNEDGDFNTQYLYILKNVYKYKFSYLPLNRRSLDIKRIDEKFLNFISLNVNISIGKLIVNNVKYDIEHILNKKNIKIQSMCQEYDVNCFAINRTHEQYDLYLKLKDYSKKYSIAFEYITDQKLTKILNVFVSREDRIKESFRVYDRMFDSFGFYDRPETEIFLVNPYPADDKAYLRQFIKVPLNLPVREGLSAYGTDNLSEMSSPNIPVEENSLQSIINGMDYINFKNEDELPTLTESYIKQMNDEYYRDKRKRKKRKKKNNK